MASDRAMLTSNVQSILTGLGSTGKTNFENFVDVNDVPKRVNDRMKWVFQQRAAYDLWIAHRIRAYGTKSFEMGKKLCTELGMLSIDGVPLGTSATTFDGLLTCLNVKVNNPVIKVDPVILQTELRKAGVSEKALAKAVEAATVTQRPAVVVEPMLKMEG